MTPSSGVGAGTSFISLYVQRPHSQAKQIEKMGVWHEIRLSATLLIKQVIGVK
jgi:hypothetical protein